MALPGHKPAIPGHVYPPLPGYKPANPHAPDVGDGLGNGGKQASPLIFDLGNICIELAALGGAGSVYWDVDQEGLAGEAVVMFDR